jgi:hypothetical protein
MSDVMERNRWERYCRAITPDIFNKTTDEKLAFILDTVSRLNSNETLERRRPAYESGIFAIGKELERRKVGAAVPPAAAKRSGAPPAPQYVFRRKGETWELAFEGSKVFHFSHRKGYEYIRELLAHPGREYTAPELTQVVEKLIPSVAPFEDGLHGLAGGQQEAMDKKGLAQALKRLDTLRADATKPTMSEVEKQEIENEIEMIEAHLKSNTHHGRAKTFRAQDDKERARITQVIKAARKAISKVLPKLNTHLRAIKTGNKFVYTGNLPFAL